LKEEQEDKSRKKQRPNEAEVEEMTDEVSLLFLTLLSLLFLSILTSL
jgi:hypothetical protein